MALLELKDVHTYYGAVHALRGVSLKVEEGEIILEYKPTEEMIADVLTKPLQGEKFIKIRDALLNW
jgi:branched-chain amino acid transport system ATP-binding protein